MGACGARLGGEDEVLRLQIAVNDVEAVHVVDRQRDLPKGGNGAVPSSLFRGVESAAHKRLRAPGCRVLHAERRECVAARA